LLSLYSSFSLFPYTTLFRSLLCLVLFYSLAGAKEIFNETRLYLAKKNISDDYYLIENMVNNKNAYKAIEILLKQKDTLACFFYRDRKSTRLNSSHVSISYAV